MEQAFFIMPPLNGPGMDNQGVLVVSLGAATAAEQEPLPDPQQACAGTPLQISWLVTALSNLSMSIRPCAQ